MCVLAIPQGCVAPSTRKKPGPVVDNRGLRTFEDWLGLGMAVLRPSAELVRLPRKTENYRSTNVVVSYVKMLRYLSILTNVRCKSRWVD